MPLNSERCRGGTDAGAAAVSGPDGAGGGVSGLRAAGGGPRHHRPHVRGVPGEPGHARAHRESAHCCQPRAADIAECTAAGEACVPVPFPCGASCTCAPRHLGQAACLCVRMLLAHTSLRTTWLRWIRRTFRSAEGGAANSAIEQSAVGRGAQARRAVMDTAGALLRADPERSLQQIVLDLPCTFFMLRSLRSASPAWMPGRPSARPSRLAVHLRTWLCCR